MGVESALAAIANWKRTNSPTDETGDATQITAARTTSLDGLQEKEPDSSSFKRTLSNVTGSMRTMFKKTPSQLALVPIEKRKSLSLFIKMSDIEGAKQPFEQFVQELLYGTFSLPDGSTFKSTRSPQSEENLSLPRPIQERCLTIDFESRAIPSEFLQDKAPFYRLLSEPGVISKIVFRNFLPHTDTNKALQQALHINPTLKELSLCNLGGGQITIGAAEIIAHVIKQTRTPQDFNFDTIPNITDIFPLESSIITKFSFLDKPFETEAFGKIVEAVTQSSKKLHLSFSKVGLSDLDALNIANLLESNTESLDLKLNDIADKTVIMMAEKLKSNRTLTSLDLSNNKITGAGFEALGPGLQSNQTLSNLYVGGENKLTREGFLALTGALEHNPKLTLHLTRAQVVVLKDKLGEFNGDLEARIKITGLVDKEELLKYKPVRPTVAPKPNKPLPALPPSLQATAAFRTEPEVSKLITQVGPKAGILPPSERNGAANNS